MADKVTEEKILGIGFQWHDAEKDTDKITYMKLSNPMNGLTEQQIKAAAANLLTGEDPILLDANGDPLSSTACFTAYVENTRNTEYDIGIES